MISAKELKYGLAVIYNGALHVVVEAVFYKPGKGGSIIRTKLRNVATGSIVSENFRSEDTFEEAYIEQKPMQYLYKDDMGYCFMDEKTYEQIHISAESIGSAMDYLKENMILTVNTHDGKVLSVIPPIHVVLKVSETDPPGFRGDTVTGGGKPATLETGKVVRVPFFIQVGDLIEVDTRTGEYEGRA